jgi:hypothetical protein
VKIEIGGRSNLSGDISGVSFNFSPVDYPDAVMNKNIRSKIFGEKGIAGQDV